MALIPFKWKDDDFKNYRPSVNWILNKYRNQYPWLEYAAPAQVLEEALVKPCRGVSILDRWAVWVYMQDKGLSWKRVYDRIVNEEWRKAKHVQKIGKGI